MLRSTLSRFGRVFGSPAASIFPKAGACAPIGVRFASKAAGGITKNNRNNAGKRRGLKKNFGQHCNTTDIIIRQKGTEWHAGWNVGLARDFTLYAKVPGVVRWGYIRNPYKKKGRRVRRFVHVVPDAIRDGDKQLAVWMKEQEADFLAEKLRKRRGIPKETRDEFLARLAREEKLMDVERERIRLREERMTIAAAAASS